MKFLTVSLHRKLKLKSESKTVPKLSHKRSLAAPIRATNRKRGSRPAAASSCALSGLVASRNGNSTSIREPAWGRHRGLSWRVCVCVCVCVGVCGSSGGEWDSKHWKSTFKVSRETRARTRVAAGRQRLPWRCARIRRPWLHARPPTCRIGLRQQLGVFSKAKIKIKIKKDYKALNQNCR